MLTRICLIVAIVAALCAGVLNFVVVKDKITALTTDRNTQRDGWTATKGELDKTQKNLARTQSQLTQSQHDLADAQTAQKKAEADETVQIQKVNDLSSRLTKMTQQLDTAQNDLAAYQHTGQSPEQVLKLVGQIKQDQAAMAAINDEKTVLTRTVTRLQSQLNLLIGTNYVVTLPAGLKGKVVVVDPKWDFVVLNIGEDQGVLTDGELLVNRDGKLVAKVIVRSIEKDRCIANIVPGWKLGEVIEGDEVIPAYPAS
ncbi:MAG TPA: hypothetical protein VMV89_10925 [Candidatus Paceibacterota bacterium]|nr:hypothetical protein [Candidatus Paceibacterota bacterium]